MKKILLILVIALLPSCLLKDRIPIDLTEAIKLLDENCSQNLKNKIKATANKDSLSDINNLISFDDINLYRWFNEENKDKNINKYLEIKGIYNSDLKLELILYTFQQFLINKSYDENEIINYYSEINKRWTEQANNRFTSDSLCSVYIPKDLDDCFKQIDSFLDEKQKVKIKSYQEKYFTSQSHYKIGTWIRNNWQLWGGSRLSKYFIDLGISHSDDMSDIIITSYYRYLKGIDIKLNEQIKEYQIYWENKKNSK